MPEQVCMNMIVIISIIVLVWALFKTRGVNMQIPKEIIEKATSGKFIFTMVSALVFAYCAVRGILPQDKIMEVILVVVYAYFTKAQPDTKTGETTTTTTEVKNNKGEIK